MTYDITANCPACRQRLRMDVSASWENDAPLIGDVDIVESEQDGDPIDNDDIRTQVQEALDEHAEEIELEHYQYLADRIADEQREP